MKYLFIAIFLFSINGLTAQEETEKQPCACCSPAHQQFDFWIGDWIVYDNEGNEVGKNKIVAMQDHCILQENWASKQSTGSSYNYYNRQDKTWNQVWVDNFGNPLVLKGGLENGAMVMKSEVTKNKEGQSYVNKVTWTPKADGSVVQLWEAVDMSGAVQKVLFRGVYKKENK